MKVSSLKAELFAAQDAAKVADDAWQTALNTQGIDRYSNAAKSGSLRELYRAKVAADRHCAELTDIMRKFQDVEQITRT